MGTKKDKLRKPIKEKIPAHRPTEYKQEFCGLLIQHMMNRRTFESFAGRPEVMVGRKTLYNWTEQHPEFLYAKEVGTSCLINALEENLDEGINGLLPGYLSASANIRMKNCAGWRDKQEIESKNENTNKYEITFIEK